MGATAIVTESIWQAPGCFWSNWPPTRTLVVPTTWWARLRRLCCLCRPAWLISDRNSRTFLRSSPPECLPKWAIITAIWVVNRCNRVGSWTNSPSILVINFLLFFFLLYYHDGKIKSFQYSNQPLNYVFIILDYSFLK